MALVLAGFKLFSNGSMICQFEQALNYCSVNFFFKTLHVIYNFGQNWREMGQYSLSLIVFPNLHVSISITLWHIITSHYHDKNKTIIQLFNPVTVYGLCWSGYYYWITSKLVTSPNSFMHIFRHIAQFSMPTSCRASVFVSYR